jgi:hypothetical protein
MLPKVKMKAMCFSQEYFYLKLPFFVPGKQLKIIENKLIKAF